MMKNKIKGFGLFLLLFFFSVQISAQSPGYMGKRFTAGYGFYLNPAFNSIILNYSDSPINTLHEFFGEVAAGKKFSLGIAAQLYRYTYNNRESVDVVGGSNYYSSQRTPKPEGTYEIKGRNYKFYTKFFRRNYLAPWGKYFLLGLVLNKYTTSYDPNTMYVYLDTQNYYYYGSVTTTILYNDWGPTTETFRTVDIFFGNGNSRVLSNNIVLDYGYSMGMIAMARMVTAIDGAFETRTVDDYISSTALNRMAAINRFNFYVKLAYLF